MSIFSGGPIASAVHERLEPRDKHRRGSITQKGHNCTDKVKMNMNNVIQYLMTNIHMRHTHELTENAICTKKTDFVVSC